MALTGDENRIRALFSELAFEDQTCAPPFERLWRRAENGHTTEAPNVRAFSGSRVAIGMTIVAFLVAGVLAVWSWSVATKAPTHNAIVIPQNTPQLPTPPSRESDAPAAFNESPRSHPRRKKSIEKRRITDTAMAEAALLSRWQSPTQLFLTSPTAANFSALPELNQSLEKLKQFLPRNTELTKESNQ